MVPILLFCSTGSPFQIDRSITTIPEEEEGENEKVSVAANFASPSADEDLGMSSRPSTFSAISKNQLSAGTGLSQRRLIE